MSTFLAGLAILGCPTEKVQLYTDIQDVFVNLGITSIESDIEAICYQGDGAEDDVFLIIQAVGDLFEGCFYATFSAMGVFLYDEVGLAEKLQLMHDLQKLANSDEPSFFLAQHDNGNSPEECLCNMLEIVGAWKAERYFEIIQRVSSTVIPNIMNMYPDKDYVAPVADPEKALSRERIKAFTAAFSGTWVEELIANGMAVGLPVERYVEELNDILPNSSEIIHQTIAIVLASNTAQDQVRNRVLVEIETLSEDPNVVTRAMKEIEGDKYKGFL